MADRVGIGREVLRGLEDGEIEIDGDQLSDIAEFLGVSPLALLKPESLLGRLALATRINGDTALEQSSVDLITRMAELHSILQDAGHPAGSIQDWPPKQLFSSWLGSVNALADWALDRLQLNHESSEGDDPFARLAASIETRLRVDVMVEHLGPDAPEGVSITNPEFQFILVNADRPRPRALFTLAHELGHILSRDGEGLTIDGDLKARTDEERSANAFAAALLMPQSDIERIIKEHGRRASSLAQMLVRFGVSYESLIYRLHNLQIINADGRNRLMDVGWTGLLANIDDDSSTSRALLAARGSRPERRPPVRLTQQCICGVRDGTVGIAPLAGLLGIEKDVLRKNMSCTKYDAREAIDADYSLPKDPHDVMISSFNADPISA